MELPGQRHDLRARQLGSKAPPAPHVWGQAHLSTDDYRHFGEQISSKRWVGLVTIGTTSIPAGWYKDPGGSDALRWWDGNQWTAHLQHSAPAAPVAPVVPFSQDPVIAAPTFEPIAPAGYGQQIQATPPVQPSEVNLSAYSPTTGYSGSPRSADQDPYAGSLNGTAGYYGNSRYMPIAQVNNAVAWLSLIAGVLAVGAIFIRLALPNGSFYLPVFGLTAIISGIRAIVRYRTRRVTVLWAPIIGVVLGAIAEILLFAAIIIPAAAGAANGTSAPTKLEEIGPTGTITVHDMGTGSPQYMPTSNGTLEQATTTLSNLVQTLKTDYAPNLTGAAADGKWPTQVSHNAAGAVHSSDGRNFGDILQPGWHLAYTVEPDGSYLLAISGTDDTELATYSSRTDEYSTICEATDQTCGTSSPITPRTITDNGASGSTGSSTTS